MAAKKIIETYKLGDRILSLTAQGKKARDVADILNREELAGKDSISQPTISRWLKKVRKDRGVTAKGIVDDYLKESIPKDLELLDEIVHFHLVLFRGKVTILEKDGEKVKAAEVGLNERRTAARDIHSILQTKMRFIGVDGDTGSAEGDGLDLDQFRTEQEKEAVND